MKMQVVMTMTSRNVEYMCVRPRGHEFDPTTYLQCVLHSFVLGALCEATLLHKIVSVCAKIVQ